MQNNRKIISVLVFCIWTFRSRLQVTGTLEGLRNSKNEEEFSVVDPFKVKFASLTVNASHGKAYEELYHDSNRETLGDIFKKRSPNKITNEKFRKNPREFSTFLKERCPMIYFYHGKTIKPYFQKVNKMLKNENYVKTLGGKYMVYKRETLKKNKKHKKNNDSAINSEVGRPNGKIDNWNKLNSVRESPLQNKMKNNTNYNIVYDDLNSKTTSQYGMISKTLKKISSKSRMNINRAENSNTIGVGFIFGNNEKIRSNDEEEKVFESEKENLFVNANGGSKRVSEKKRKSLKNKYNKYSKVSRFKSENPETLFSSTAIIQNKEEYDEEEENEATEFAKSNVDRTEHFENENSYTFRTTHSLSMASGKKNSISKQKCIIPTAKTDLRKSDVVKSRSGARKKGEKKNKPPEDILLKDLYDEYYYYLGLGDNYTGNKSNASDLGDFKSFYYNENTTELHFQKNFKHDLNNVLCLTNDNSTEKKNTSHTDSHKSSFWSNLSNKSMADRLLMGKNYLINIFRRKDNSSLLNKERMKEIIKLSSDYTTTLPLWSHKNNGNSHYKSRQNQHLHEYHQPSKLRTSLANESKREIKRSVVNYIQNNSLPKNISPYHPLIVNLTELFKKNNEISLSDAERNSFVQSYYTEIISTLFDKLFQDLVRQKRKSGSTKKCLLKRILPGKYPGRYKHIRRSITEKNTDFDDYNTKLQNLQKDLLELQKSLSSPKVARSNKNEEKNLTLQIRVIVDVVNGTAARNDNSSLEEDLLNKRDTALVEKNLNIDRIPLPLDHESPLIGEGKKGNNVWRNKRADRLFNEMLRKNVNSKERNRQEISDHIVRNITYLLDNYKGNSAEDTVIEECLKHKPSILVRKSKRSFMNDDEKHSFFMFHTRKPINMGEIDFTELLDTEITTATTTQKQLLRELVTFDIYNNTYNLNNPINSSNLNFTGETTTQNINETIINEQYNPKVAMPNEQLSKRNRRSILNIENKQLHENWGEKSAKNKKNLFQEEIKALKDIINRIETKVKSSKVLCNATNENAINNERNSLKKVIKKPVKITKILNTKGNQSSELFKNATKTKLSYILKSIEHIKNGLEQRKPINSKRRSSQKHIFSKVIAREAKYMPNYQFRKQLMKINHTHLTTAVSNKPVYLFFKDINIKKINSTEQTKYLEKLDLDQGNNVTIEWCCPHRQVTTENVNIQKTKTLVNQNVTKISLAKVRTTNIVECTMCPSTFKMTQNLTDSLSYCTLPHDDKCTTKKIRQRGYQCHHHYKNHSLFKEHQLTNKSKLLTSTGCLVEY